jgi:hypothetical protein
MAMYVWYDGKNLAENFGIRKSTIKTDENIDMEEAQFEDALESGINVDYSPIINDSDDAPNEVYEDLKWVEHDAKNTLTSRQMIENQTTENAMLKSKLLTTNKDLKRQLEEKEYGIISYNQYMANAYTDLPEYLFDMDTDPYEDDINYDPNIPRSPNVGNLSSMIDFL